MPLPFEWEQVPRAPQDVELEPVRVGRVPTEHPLTPYDVKRQESAGSPEIDQVDLPAGRLLEILFERERRGEGLGGSIQHAEIEIGVGRVAPTASTIETHLNSGTSCLVHDVYRRFLGPGRTERHDVFAGGVTTAMLMIVAALLTSALRTAKKSSSPWGSSSPGRTAR